MQPCGNGLQSLRAGGVQGVKEREAQLPLPTRACRRRAAAVATLMRGLVGLVPQQYPLARGGGGG